MKTKEEFKKSEKKVFTKEEGNIIINKDCNPLKVNYKIYERGSGLFMKNETLSIVRRISKKDNNSKNDFNISEFVNKRIMDNINLFSEEEKILIKNNKKLLEKIYLLGIFDKM